MEELTLDDMLSDPVVNLIMARDGVNDNDIRALFQRLNQRYRSGQIDPRVIVPWSEAA